MWCLLQTKTLVSRPSVEHEPYQNSEKKVKGKVNRIYQLVLVDNKAT